MGPSSKTCPKCESQCRHSTSVLCLERLRSSCFLIFSSPSDSEKLGHPQLESNLVSDRNKSFPQHKHLYVPFVLVSRYFPLKGSSVPFFLQISNCSSVSISFHSYSLRFFLFVIFSFVVSFDDAINSVNN